MGQTVHSSGRRLGANTRAVAHPSTQAPPSYRFTVMDQSIEKQFEKVEDDLQNVRRQRQEPGITEARWLELYRIETDLIWLRGDLWLQGLRQNACRFVFAVRMRLANGLDAAFTCRNIGSRSYPRPSLLQGGPMKVMMQRGLSTADQDPLWFTEFASRVNAVFAPPRRGPHLKTD